MADDPEVGIGRLYIFENDWIDQVIEVHRQIPRQEIYIYPQEIKYLYNCLGKILTRQKEEK